MKTDIYPKAILIAGPTASGKSRLALELASRHNGVILNADSMQVYSDLRVLTARPSIDEEAQAPHRLYGHIDARVRYSAGAWLRDVTGQIAQLQKTAHTPIIVGGTGLYFKALTRGLAPVPEVPRAIARKWRHALADLGAQVLHRRLRACDETGAARIEPSDGQRITRALSVLEATGEPLHVWQNKQARPVLERAHCRAIRLAVDRAALYAAINCRFDTMMDRGALAEVAALAARGLDPSLPAMKAHGVPHLQACLDGRMDLSAAIARSKQDTRNYAKRQFTWMRRFMADWQAHPAALQV